MALADEVEKMRYKVMRDDKPITNEELTLDEANKELERWHNILKRWPDGTKVRLEPVIKQYMEATTKIVGGLSEFKEEKTHTKGLLQRLEEAKTSEEVDYLMGVGKTYRKVTIGTMRKWAKVAAKRKCVLSVVNNISKNPEMLDKLIDVIKS